MTAGANHQGVAVIIAEQEYCEVSDILALAEERGEKPFIIICDEIEDPHNLGAIIRTAEAAGVHGIIIPKRRSASLNVTVAKAACGALEYMKVARVTNIANTIDELKEKGIWVYGADMDGEDYSSTDFDCPAALVIGNEGKGIGPLVAKKCDAIISLPMLGKINSLNASVAAGILMYAVVKSR
jgi:23S rRNA (guanosine2251-2'-O)-methyltransferase